MELEKENLCGYIFKSGSPSSGMETVKVYDRNNVPAKIGAGIYARVFMDHFPLLPVEDEGRLNDPKLRKNFIERIFTLKRWREAMAEKKGVGSLVAFHTQPNSSSSRTAQNIIKPWANWWPEGRNSPGKICRKSISAFYSKL